MTPEKRLSLLSQAGNLMRGRLMQGFIDRSEMYHFAECVALLAAESDEFIAANMQGLADGLGLSPLLFTETQNRPAPKD